MEDIILIGLGGHGKSVADSIEQKGEYRIVGYSEPTDLGLYHGYTWLGTDEELGYYFGQGIRNVFICTGYLGKGRIRDKLYALVKKIGFKLPVILDPSAVISKEATFGEGTFVGKRALVNAGSRIGKMCIINSGSVVEHECIVGDFTHISVGAVLCGNVHISNHSFIGAHSTIIQNVGIGKDAIVGAATLVRENVADNRMVFGGYKSNNLPRNVGG